MPGEPFSDTAGTVAVRGVLHRPAKPNGDALALTHGAGGNCNGPLLVAVAETFADAGFIVLRYDLPFRQQRAFGPPRGAGDADRAGVVAAVGALRKMVKGRILAGGHSYGGRMTSMVAAETPNFADALLLFSYPLHAPGRPERPRSAHLPNLKMPVLFIHGAKDGFGSIDEMESARKLVPAPTSLLIVENAGHDLGWGARAKRRDETLPQTVLAELRRLLG
jgi:uncharacterized protein